MKLKNEELLSTFTGLNTLSQEKFPAKLAWKIATALKILSPFVEVLEKTMTDARLKYAVRDEHGEIIPAKNEDGEILEGTLQVTRENIDVLNAELFELLNAETEIMNISISISDFPESFNVSPNVMQSLHPILSE